MTTRNAPPASMSAASCFAKGLGLQFGTATTGHRIPALQAASRPGDFEPVLTGRSAQGDRLSLATPFCARDRRAEVIA